MVTYLGGRSGRGTMSAGRSSHSPSSIIWFSETNIHGNLSDDDDDDDENDDDDDDDDDDVFVDADY